MKFIQTIQPWLIRAKGWAAYILTYAVFVIKRIVWVARQLVKKYPVYTAVLGALLLLAITANFFWPTIYNVVTAPRPLPLAEAPKNSGFTYIATDKRTNFSALIGESKTNAPKVQASFADLATVDFVLNDINQNISKPSKSGNKVVFKNIRTNIDIEYQTLTNGIKENLIIKTPQRDNSYTFTVNTYGATAKRIGTNLYTPVFYDSRGNYVFHFEKPFAVDAKGARNDAVLLSLHKKENETAYQATVTVNKKWLEDPARVYPISIDPSVIYDTQTFFDAGQLNRVVTTKTETVSTGAGVEYTTDGNTTALWHLNETTGTLADASGNNHTGTATGTSVVTGHNGLSNAREFDGSSYINIGNGAQLATALPITIEAWAYVDANTNGIFIQQNSSASVYYGFWVSINNGNSLSASYGDGTAIGSTGRRTGNSKSGIFIPNAWNHIAIVITGATNFKFYVNGIDTGTPTYTGSGGAFNNSSNPGYIGKHIGAQTVYFDGQIDEIRISNKARSVAEIRAAMQSTSQTSLNINTSLQELPADEHTVGLWHFNEASGDVVDSSKYGHTGTVTGTTVVSGQGGMGNARNFNGTTSDRVTIADSLPLRLQLNQTIEAWVKLDSFPAVWWRVIGKGLNNTRNYGLWIAADGDILYQIYSAAATPVTCNFQNNAGAGDPANIQLDSKWHHLAATYDGATGSVYVDGVLAHQSACAVTPANDTDALYFGYFNTPYYYGGFLDEVRISNIVRTPEEIRLAAQKRPYATFTSDVLDFNSPTNGWSNNLGLSWTELGAPAVSGNAETPLDTTDLVAQWNFNAASGTTATNDAGVGTCGGTASNCDFTLNNFANTSARDVATASGWTADNLRWGAGALMISSLATPGSTADNLSRADPANNALDPVSSDFSLEAWVKTMDVSSEIFSNNSGGVGNCTAYGYYLGIDASGYPIFNFDTNGATAGCDGQIASSTKLINDGAWHNVVVTVQSGVAANLYVDGVLTGTDTAITEYTNIAPTGVLYIGGPVSGPVFDGIVDTMRFYMRVLPSTEILANYNAANVEFQTRVGDTTDPNDGSWEEWRPSSTIETQLDSFDSSYLYTTTESGLTAYWAMDEIVASPLADSKNSNTANSEAARATYTTSVGTGADGACTVSSGTININTGSCLSSPRTYGDATIFTVTTNTSANQNQIVLAGANTNGLATGDEVLIINLQGTLAGQYETHRISGISSQTLTLDDTLTNAYDGTTQKIVVQRIAQYTNVTVSSGANFIPGAWDGTKGGVLFFRASGTVTVEGSINANGVGYRGGAGGIVGSGSQNGESYDAYGSGGGGFSTTLGTQGGGNSSNNTTTSPNNGAIRGGGGGGGMSGTASTGNEGGGGGAGGAYGGGGGGGGAGGDTSPNLGGVGGTGGTTDVVSGGGGRGVAALAGYAGANAGGTTTNGQPGSGTTSASGGGGANSTVGSGGGGGGGGLYGSASLNTLFLGSGGGGGGGAAGPGPQNGGDAGAGGGIVVIAANAISVTGTVSSNGAGGTNAGARSGAGGAGSGGSVSLAAATQTLGAALVTASGGTGGTRTSYGAAGGSGGVGRIVVSYTTSISGSTNPLSPINSTVITDGKFGNGRSFDGTYDYSTTTYQSNPSPVSVEAWFKTDSASGHRIVGLENNKKGETSGDFDRHLYVGTDGKLYFGINDGSIKTVASTGTVTDNSWHHAVGVYTGSNINLYLDGISQGNLATGATTTSGYWRIGGYALAGWTNGSSGYFDGSIDEVRIYSSALSAATVLAHYHEGASEPRLMHQTKDTVTKLEGSASQKYQLGQMPLDEDTVGLWHLDETGGTSAYIKDATANVNNGTPNGSPTVVNGVIGKAYKLNGSSDYIEIPDNNALDIATNGTVEAWIKTDTNKANNWFLCKTGNYCLGVNATGGFLFTGATAVSFASTSLVTGSWHHVAITNNDTTNTYYIDGVSVGTDATGWGTTLTGALRIGNDGGANYFSGSIDEVRISNTVRTANEIAEEYKAGAAKHITKSFPSADLSSANKLAFNIAADRPGTYLTALVGSSNFANYLPDANTIGFWHLDEKPGTGVTIKDAASPAHSGTATGVVSDKGIIGTSANFTSGDDINLGNLSLVDSRATFTVDAWLYPTAQTAATHFRAFNEHNVLYVGQYGAQISFYMGNGSAWLISDVTSAALPIKEWSHVAWVKSGTSYYIYLNGRLIKQVIGTAPGTIGSSTTGNYISTYDGATQGWVGNIDEMRISDIARSGAEIRAAYESGKRSHSITIDFGAKLDSGNLITGSGDTSFTIDATYYGLSNKGSNLHLGDKVIVRENYNGTTYIAQGTVSAVNASTGAVTVTSWDSGSTFPSGGYTVNASIFKWQREYYDLNGSIPAQRSAVAQLILRATNGKEGRTLWVDDAKSTTGYLTTPAGSAISSSTGHRYAQFRMIFTSVDYKVSSPVTNATIDFQTPAPDPPHIDLPTPLSPTSIQWNFTPSAAGSTPTQFRVLDASNNIMKTCDGGAELTSCVETGLSPNTSYTRKIIAVNSSGNSLFSPTATTYTHAAVPPAPTANTPTETTIQIALDDGDNPTGTQLALYIEANTTTCDGSGGYFVNSEGGNGGDSLSAAPWLTGSVTVTGLNLNTTQYAFCTVARNANSITTDYGATYTGNAGFMPINIASFTFDGQQGAPITFANKYIDGNNRNRTVFGLDHGSDAPADNDSVLIMKKGTLQINANETLVVGEIQFPVGSTASIAMEDTANKTGQIKPGVPLWVKDDDDDGLPAYGYSTSIPNVYFGAKPDATSKRLKSLSSVISLDCNDNNKDVKQPTETSFVGIGISDSGLLYSRDGITWFNTGASVLSSAMHGKSVAYNGTIWVGAASGNNTLAYSDDGITWTGLGSTIFTTGAAVAWNGIRWVATGNGTTHTIATSTDGINWTGLGNSIFTTFGYGVAWNGSKWVATGNGTNNTLAVSEDGINWTGLGTSISSPMYDVSTNGSLWIAGGNGNPNSLAASSDGVNWTGLGTSSIADVGIISWNGTRWIAGGLGGNIVTSTDGVNWSLISNSPFSSNVHGFAWNGSMWVATGQGTNNVAYSTDGLTWTGGGLTRTFAAVGSAPSPRLIPAIPNKCSVKRWFAGPATSTDGFVWTATSNLPSASGFAYNGTRMVAAAGANGMYYSANGINWTKSPQTVTTSPEAVGWDGTRWVAGGSVPYPLAHSADGINWTGRGASLGIGFVEDLAWNGSYWVGVSSNSTTNTIVWAANGINWTGRGHTIFGGDGNGVAAGSDKFVAVGSGTNSLAYSETGQTWTGLGTSIFSTVGYKVAWNGSKYVAVGDGTNSIASSGDGINWTGQGTPIFTIGRGIAWNGYRWIASGDGLYSIAHSLDGTQWTGVVVARPMQRGYGIVWSGTRWVVVGDNPGFITYSNDATSWTSNQGWGFANHDPEVIPTTEYQPDTYANGKGVAWNGSMFVMVASGSNATNTIAYSADGITWTGLGTSILSSGNFVKWVGTKWIAGGSGSNGLVVSTDGIHWTAKPAGVFTVAYDVATDGSKYVAAVAGDYDLAQSSDGINWTGIAIPAFLNQSQAIQTISYNASIGKWVTAVRTSTGNAPANLGYSDDGITWSQSPASGQSWTNMTTGTAAGGQMFLAWGSRWLVSTDGINWTSYVSDVISANLNYVTTAYWNGSIWATSGRRDYPMAVYPWFAISTDGHSWTGIADPIIENGQIVKSAPAPAMVPPVPAF